jgi:hypothetical protein
MMGTVIQDIRFGMRMLAKRPAFTAIVVLVLAVGIGANTALFSVFKTVVLSPLPFPQPEQLMFVNSTVKGLENLISGPDYVDWCEQNRVFSAISAVQLNQRYTLTGTGSPRVVRGWGVTNDFHQVLGVRPYLGRWFLPEDATQGKADDILRLTMQRGFVLIAAGAFTGLLIALALGRVVKDLLFQTNQADPLVFGMGILFLTGAGLLACYIPARRAAKVDPMEALRYE